MTKLIQYSLNADKAIKFIKWNFENGNALCKNILKFTHFGKGKFFTFLKEGLNSDTVNEFRSIHVGGNVKEHISEWLYNKNPANNNLIYTFDEDDAFVSEVVDHELYTRLGVHNNEEVYYLLNGKDITKKNIKECLYASDIIWHGLCVVSKHPYKQYKQSKDKSISRDELEQIVINAELILVLAYDAEGYIIWERTSE